MSSNAQKIVYGPERIKYLCINSLVKNDDTEDNQVDDGVRYLTFIRLYVYKPVEKASKNVLNF